MSNSCLKNTNVSTASRAVVNSGDVYVGGWGRTYVYVESPKISLCKKVKLIIIIINKKAGRQKKKNCLLNSIVRTWSNKIIRNLKFGSQSNLVWCLNTQFIVKFSSQYLTALVLVYNCLLMFTRRMNLVKKLIYSFLIFFLLRNMWMPYEQALIYIVSSSYLIMLCVFNTYTMYNYTP